MICMKKYNGPSSSQLSLPVSIRAGNESFHNHREGIYWGPLLVDSANYCSHIKDPINAKQAPKQGK